MRPFLAIALGTTLGFFIADVGAQECAKCAPKPDLGVGIVGPGEVSVCFQDPADSSILTDNQADLEAGFEYWENAYPTVNQSLSFSYSTGKEPNNLCDADVVIKAGDLGCCVSGQASPTTGITLNTRKLSDPLRTSGEKQHTAGHEMGHVLGWDNVNDPDCHDDTIMYCCGGGSLPSLQCGDQTALTTQYIGGNTEDGGNEYEPIEDDCYDWYHVTFFYYWNETQQQWFYAGSVWDYQGVYCGPPPI